MKNLISYIVFGILGIFFGVFMINQPETIINIAAFLFSVVLAIRGLRALVDAIRFSTASRKILINGVEVEAKVKTSVKTTMLINALVSALIGVLALIIALSFLSSKDSGIMVGVIYIIAIGFLATGVIGFVENRMMKPFSELFEMFSDRSVLYIAVGILLLLFPLMVGHTIITVAGIVVIISSVTSMAGGILTFYYRLKRKRQEKKETVEYTEIK
ncbi:MAG: DUF308 domain-containing protein [Spirochaetales bacterium]|nr:DUF308 domain-containing protein [Candidatus Physcosoma equi]